jgi:hypothetical protein
MNVINEGIINNNNEMRLIWNKIRRIKCIDFGVDLKLKFMIVYNFE